MSYLLGFSTRSPLAPSMSLFPRLDGIASDALLIRLQTWLRGVNNVQTVIATHDATDALATAAEVLLIRDGRPLRSAPPAKS